MIAPIHNDGQSTWKKLILLGDSSDLETVYDEYNTYSADRPMEIYVTFQSVYDNQSASTGVPVVYEPVSSG